MANKKKRRQESKQPRTRPLEDLLWNRETTLYGQVCWSIANRGTEPPRSGEEVTEAINAIRKAAGRATTKLAMEFLILTASRTSEVLGATWDEVDLSSATWAIPVHRMKMRVEHRVPLSTGALAVLGTGA